MYETKVGEREEKKLSVELNKIQKDLKRYDHVKSRSQMGEICLYVELHWVGFDKNGATPSYLRPFAFVKENK